MSNQIPIFTCAPEACLACHRPPAPAGVSEGEAWFLAGVVCLWSSMLLGRGQFCARHMPLVLSVLKGASHAHEQAETSAAEEIAHINTPGGRS